MKPMKIMTKREAKARGLRHYFTGEPCSRGHVAERYVSNGGCRECQRAHHRENPEYYRDRAVAWNKAHPEQVLESARRTGKQRTEDAHCWRVVVDLAKSGEKRAQWVVKQVQERAAS